MEELVVGEDVSHVGWGLLREVAIAVGLGVKGVGAMIQHLLSIVVGVSGCLDAEVAEHGVGFPASQ